YPENTMRAFERARNLGAWGIEFDVRFTKDGVPVVNHDFDLIRCHKCEGIVHELKFPEIRSRAPLRPTREEVLGLSGVHFMIEVKSSLNAEQRRTLTRLLSPCEPV